MDTSTQHKHYYIETWGCQMNVHDSERIAGSLRELGYRAAKQAESADLVLLNTCAVRDKAVHKVISYLGRLRPLKQRNPRLVVGVVGCVAQQERERLLTSSPLVDLVVGPRALHRLPQLLDEVVEGRRCVDVSQTDPRFDTPQAAPERRQGPRAYVTVMEGCNKNCSFCIVPFTRGRETYRPAGQIVEECRTLVGQGVLELELLGQNVNAWTDGEHDFAGLLRMVDRVPGLRRLRFTTSHPRHLSDAIIDAMAACPSVCPELHLPAQSGSDRVLKAMYRGYTHQRYLDRVQRLRQQLPGVALSTDIIVGFPGETEQDFQLTEQLVEEICFDQVYAFVYSPRPYTRALELDDPTPAELKDAWLQRLLEAQRERQLRLNEAFVGRSVEVLVEGRSRTQSGRFTGRSRCRRIVNFEAGGDPTGSLVQVQIEAAGPYSLVGRLASTAAA